MRTGGGTGAGAAFADATAGGGDIAGADDTAARGILEGRALELTSGGSADPGQASGAAAVSAPPAEGSLAPGSTAGAKTAAEGEPL